MADPFGTILGIIELLEKSKKAYDNFKDAKDLPDAFREAHSKIQLTEFTLEQADAALKSRFPSSSKDERDAIEGTLTICHTKAVDLEALFTAVCKDDKKHSLQRYADTLKRMFKDTKTNIEQLWKEFLEGVRVLLDHLHMKDTLYMKRIVEAIDAIAQVEPSLPENQGQTFNISGGQQGVVGINKAPFSMYSGGTHHHGSETSNTTSYSHVSASGSAHQHNGNINGSVTNNFYGLSIREDKDEARQGSRNVHWVVRRRTNALFTGQEGILTKLEEALAPGSERPERQFVLHGVGGVGKSELALRYAENHSAKYWGVFWIDFGSLDSARQGFGRIAKRCGWATSGGDNLVEEVVENLSEAEQPWLLILDNCDDSNVDYSQYFPSSNHGAVIMTSRLDVAEIYGTAGSYHLEGLDDDNALKLLEKTSNIVIRGSEAKLKAAKTVLNRLGSHALAITVAGSLLKTGIYGLEEYPDVLSKQESHLLYQQPKQAASTYGTIHATFEVSAARLEAASSEDEASKHALELLGVLAFLDRTGIPEDLFTRAWKWGHQHRYDEGEVDLDNNPDNHDWDPRLLSEWHFEGALRFEWAEEALMPIMFREARARLTELSLVTLIPDTKTPDTKTITMHPLLHSWARNRLSIADRAIAWRQTACTLVLSVWNYHGWQDFTPRMRRHCEECYKFMPDGAVSVYQLRNTCRVLVSIWWQLLRAGSLQVEPLLSHIDTLVSLQAPPNTFHVSISHLALLRMKSVFYSDKAENSRNQADFHRALDSCSEEEIALQKREEPLNYERLWAGIRTANNLTNLGRGEKAVDLLQLILPNLDELPPQDIASIWHSLSLALSQCGRSQEALGAIEKAVSIKKSILSEGNPSLLVSRHILASAHLDLGDYDTAIEILEEIVRVKSSFRNDHDSSLLMYQYELGCAYLKYSQPEKALNLFDLVAARHPETLRSEHPMRLAILSRLAACYSNLGQQTRAVELMEDVVDLRRLLAPNDQQRYQSEYALIVYLINANRAQEARALYDRVMKTAVMLPENHRRALRGLEMKIVKSYRITGQLEQAISMLERMVEIRSKAFAPNEKERYRPQLQLIECYIESQRAADAQELLGRAMETADLLPENAQQDLRDLELSIAKCFRGVGQLKQAISIMEGMVEVRGRKMPPGDGERCGPEVWLFVCYIEDERAPQARQLFNRVVEFAELLPEHVRQTLPGWVAQLEKLERSDLRGD